MKPKALFIHSRKAQRTFKLGYYFADYFEDTSVFQQKFSARLKLIKKKTKLIYNDVTEECYKSFFFRSTGNQAATKMLFAVTGVFLVSNLSTVLLSAVLGYFDSLPGELTGTQFLVGKILSILYPVPVLFNSSANFFVLFLTMKKFKETLRKVLGI